MNSNSTANFHEMVMAVFQRRDPGGVIWQPRLEYWYQVNKKRGTLPAPLCHATLLDVYDYCHASVRYFGDQLRVRYENVNVTEKWEDEKRLRRSWETPIGTLTDVIHHDEWQLSGHFTEYKIKTTDDLKILEYILQDETWYWDQEAYEQEIKKYGNRGVPQFFYRRTPIQGLFIEHMGFEKTIYAMHDYPEVISRYVGVATEADDAMYEVLCACPVQLLNFGENIDAHLDPPPIWEKHLLPHYRKHTQQLHVAGKFVFIHVDGTMKSLLPHMRDCPWDAIEAATPLPQGDVTLEEIKASLGDLILLDGIPAVYFLPYYPVETLIECAKKVVDMFHPRLILGISDEIPPDGEIERVRLIGELVKEL